MCSHCFLYINCCLFTSTFCFFKEYPWAFDWQLNRTDIDISDNDSNKNAYDTNMLHIETILRQVIGDSLIPMIYFGYCSLRVALWFHRYSLWCIFLDTALLSLLILLTHTIRNIRTRKRNCERMASQDWLTTFLTIWSIYIVCFWRLVHQLYDSLSITCHTFLWKLILRLQSLHCFATSWTVHSDGIYCRTFLKSFGQRCGRQPAMGWSRTRWIAIIKEKAACGDLDDIQRQVTTYIVDILEYDAQVGEHKFHQLYLGVMTSFLTLIQYFQQDGTPTTHSCMTHQLKNLFNIFVLVWQLNPFAILKFFVPIVLALSWKTVRFLIYVYIPFFLHNP